MSNVGESYENRLPYVNMVFMLLVDAALYFLLAWYLDKVRRATASLRNRKRGLSCLRLLESFVPTAK